jgi:hypothetical protein
LLGHLHRLGQCYSTDTQRVYDHDFRHLANAQLVPHGVFDYFGNAGFMTLGTSRETSAFVCDAIALSWREGIHACYPEATEILLTFDCGGANAARSLRFKEDAIELSDRLGLPLRIAHYPPYTSKWHPIEHRLFSHVERSLRGVILDCHETALGADGSSVLLQKAGPISESAGWHSPLERVNSRCREAIPVRHRARSVSRACLIALGLLQK